VASYLERQGLSTFVCDETRQAVAQLGRDPAAGKAIVLAHQSRLLAAPRAAVETIQGHRTILIVPSGAEPIPGFHHTIREPFFLDQLVNAIKSIASPPPATPATTIVPPASRGPDADLLRGLAHAINNPLTAALGWLRLLEGEVGEREQTKRLVSQSRFELERLGQVAQTLAHLASPTSSGSATFDLRQVATEVANAALAQGARITFRAGPAKSFLVSGNPADYDLLLRLLTASAHDGGGLEQVEMSLAEEKGVVRLGLSDPKGRVPDPDTATDLGKLLRSERHQRALGIALGQALARRTGGSFRSEALHPKGASFLLSVPAAARTMTASKGAP
jgi:signal transduction histidine kinase